MGTLIVIIIFGIIFIGLPILVTKENAKKTYSTEDTGRKYICLSVRNGSRYGYVCR